MTSAAFFAFPRGARNGFRNGKHMRQFHRGVPSRIVLAVSRNAHARCPIAEWPEIGELQVRAPRDERKQSQADLNLPPYPTTTTGSLPGLAAAFSTEASPATSRNDTGSPSIV